MPEGKDPLDVILTADRGSFTDYGGTSVLGYVACMPSRLGPGSSWRGSSPRG